MTKIDFPLKTCKGLWFPISELADKHHSSLMLASPKLIDDDSNPQGVSTGYFQDTEGWVVNGWDMNNDEPTKVILAEEDVTHFMYVQGPFARLEDFEKYSADWVRQLATDKRATYLVNHSCSICDVPVGYILNITEDSVYYNSNCGCPGNSPLRVSSWQDISDHLQRQSSDEIRDKILERLG